MNFSRGISYDRIGTRAYGLMLDERLDRLAENRQALSEMRQRRRERQQEATAPPEHLNFDTNVFEEERGDSPPIQMQAETIEDDVQDTLDYKNMPFNDRVLFYADYIQQSGLSNEGVKLLEQLMAVIFGTLPPIKYTSHVVPLNKNILEQYQHKKTYFCYSCGDMLHHWRDKCGNAMCSLYRVAIKRAKGVQRVEVHVLDMIPQLSDLMKKEIKSIMNFHRTLHENGGSPANDRSDMRYFDGFYRNIESSEEFGEKTIKILMSLSIDGFVPKRLTRREMWPLYLRVDNLPRSEADKYTNSILCGIVYSLGKPSLKMMESLFGRLESELNALREEPIRIDIDGEIWSLEVRLHRGIADMQAQKALFGVPRWSSAQGCSKCYIMGQRTEGQRVWIQQEDDNSSLREPSSYRIDGQLSRNGIPNETPIMRIIKPCDFAGDALHVCSEGITKDRIRDLFNVRSRFAGMRVNREGIAGMKKALQEMSSYTYASSVILSLDDLRTCKAVELDELAFVVFPAAAATGLIPSPVAAVSLIGYWLCLRLISDPRLLTTRTIEKAQKLADLTKGIWMTIAPGIFTMKCHWFFDHGMKEEIENYGTLYQWSAAPFESHHRRLQINVDQTTTNCSTVMIERYLLYKKMRYLIEEKSTNNSDFLSLKKKVDNKHKAKFPLEISVNASIYIPKASKVDPNLLEEEHKAIILQSGEEAYSRIVIRGKVYSSRKYWKRKANSRQDMVWISGNDNSAEVQAIGSIILFLYSQQNCSVRVLLNEYQTISPFARLRNCVENIDHPMRETALELMDIIDQNNVHFRKQCDGDQIRSTRLAQMEMSTKIKEMSDFLHELNEQEEPYDIQSYVGKLQDSKRRVNNVNQIDQVSPSQSSRRQQKAAFQTVPLPSPLLHDCSRSPIDEETLKTLGTLTKILYSLLKFDVEFSIRCVRALIRQDWKLRMNKPKSPVSFSVIALLRLIASLFPVSDRWYPVCSPAMALAAVSLAKCHVENLGIPFGRARSEFPMQTPKTRIPTRPVLQTLSNVKPQTLSNVKPQTLSNKPRAAPARTELYVSDVGPHQTTPGNVYNRPELDFETETEEREAPSSLYDCIVMGTLNMKEAAQLILLQKRNGQFNKSIYEEFVRSEAASRVHDFSFDGLIDLEDAVLEMRLCNLANTLLGQIQCAKLDRSNRMVELTGRELKGVGSKPSITLRNCVRIWNIEGPLPFITTALEELIEDYKPKESNNLFQMFACFYRFLIMRITEPPQRIQGYSVRLNGKRGRKDSLENLPRHIEHLLLDFLEDLIGYGHNELKSGARANTTHSKFVLSLGNTDAERQAALDAKLQTRMVYRAEMFKALQLALRDVRTYTYDESRKVWIAGDRKLKRAKLDVTVNLREALDEDSMNSTAYNEEENLVPASPEI